MEGTQGIQDTDWSSRLLAGVVVIGVWRDRQQTDRSPSLTGHC